MRDMRDMRELANIIFMFKYLIHPSITALLTWLYVFIVLLSVKSASEAKVDQ